MNPETFCGAINCHCDRMSIAVSEIATLKAENESLRKSHESDLILHNAYVEAVNRLKQHITELDESQIDVRSKIDKIVIGWRNDWNEFDGRELKKQIDKVWAELPTYKEEK